MKIPESGWKCCRIGHEKFIQGFRKEVKDHYNFIKKNQFVEEVYEYTTGSGKLRDDLTIFSMLNGLIDMAPKLEHSYTVYRMGPPFSDISLYNSKGKYIEDTQVSKLKVGDIFTEKRDWVESGTAILSATYDKSYPLADFTVGLSQEDKIITLNDVKQYLKILKKDTFFYSYFDSAKDYEHYKSVIQELYDITREQVKRWIKYQYPMRDAYPIVFHDLKELFRVTDGQVDTARKLYREIYKSHYLSKKQKFVACCFFKIKLKNRKGLFIERISRYPQQREILLPNGTKFRVTGITTENYGTIDTQKVKKYMEEDENDDIHDESPLLNWGPEEVNLDLLHSQEGFIDDEAKFRQYKNMSSSLPLKVKKVKVYELETI